MLDSERQYVRQLITHKCGVNTLLLMRYYTQWKKSQHSSASPLIDRRPWMTFQSISLLEKMLKRGNSVFEYGGGGSTLYFLDKGAKVTTVEHDKDWFDKLSSIIAQNGLSKFWAGRYTPPEDDSSVNNMPPSNPNSYASGSEEFIGKTFKNYVNTIKQFPDGYFDFVIIDGRARPSCIMQSAQKVKVGGHLVLDNAERDYYLTPETKAYLANFKIELDKIGPSPHVNFFTQTNVWTRLH